MPADNPTENLSILSDAQRGFDTAMRGYDRRQVDEMLASLDEEVRGANSVRNAAVARSADLAAQLASAHAQVEALRRQLSTATEEITIGNVDTRARELLETARANATKVRSEALAYEQHVRLVADEAADRIRANARIEAEQTLEAAKRRHTEADDTFRRRIAEADRYRAEITERSEREIAQAREQEAQLTREATAERSRLDAEAEAARARADAEVRERLATAEEDFEIALRGRRTAEAASSAEQLAAAEAAAHRTAADAAAEAGRLVSDATAQADRLVSEATAHATTTVQAATEQVERLDAQRDRTHADLAALHERLADVISGAGVTVTAIATGRPSPTRSAGPVEPPADGG